MSKQVQIRRGNTAQNQAFTGVEGEVTYDTEAKRLITHDGSTAGGELQAKKSEADAASALATTNLALSAGGLFGDGSDGTVTFDGSATVLGLAPSSNTYTLIRNIYPANMTVNSGVRIITSGFKIYCSGTLTNAGFISANGANGGNGATPTAGSLGAAYSANELGANQSGGAGGAGGNFGAGSPGGGVSAPPTGGGGASGHGGAGGIGVANPGGSPNPSAFTPILFRFLSHTIVVWSAGTWTRLLGGQGGTGGGGGGGNNVNGQGGGGGGGGAGGGVLLVFAKTIVNTNGVISANGGNGGNGGNGTVGQQTGGGGGAGGGGGGLVFLAYVSLTGGTVQAIGGTKGTAGSGNNGGANGVDGVDGSAGKVLSFNVATGTFV